MKAPIIEQIEMSKADVAMAERIAAKMGYEQTAYTSTSALWGLFCLPENPRTAKPGQRTTGGCIIKTVQFGFLFVADLEDLGMQTHEQVKARLCPERKVAA